MTDSQPWTIKRLLDWTQEFFANNGSESPRLEAEILLSEALDCQRIDLYTRFNDVPEEPGLSKFRDWVKRRSTGEPVAYLVGHREFYSLKFNVSSDVLIPRPETEHLVVAAIDKAKEKGMPLRLLDVGTGSGCVAITLAKHLPDASITAVDISPAAIAVAQKNAEFHDVEIEFLVSDLFEAVGGRTFDMIVSNPPYIGTEEQGTVANDVEQNEPHAALFAGPRGLDVISRLVVESIDHLSATGVLIFETSPIIMDDCLDLLRAQSTFGEPRVLKDYSGHRRVVVVDKQAG